MPCFELWVLLHLERTDRSFANCTVVVARIRREHLEGYQKANDKVAKELMSRVDAALANARWLAERTAIDDENPSTSVHTVLQHLKDVEAS